ncbi:MAG: hypothetical protein WCP85_29955, partial [Mariniphaga sp.]
GSACIYIPDFDVNIEVEGTNTIGGGKGYSSIFSGEGKIVFSGRGSLNSTAQISNSYSSGSITFNSGIFNLETSTGYALISGGGITINGGTINAKSTSPNSDSAIRAGNVNINGGSVLAESTSSYAIQASNNVVIKGDNTSVKATSLKDVCAIYSQNGFVYYFSEEPYTAECNSFVNVGLFKDLAVLLPNPANIAMYKNSVLELTDLSSSQKVSMTITDLTNYTFRRLTVGGKYKVILKNKYGDILGEINDITISSNENKVQFLNLKELVPVTISIFNESDANVTDQTAIKWYDQKGIYLAQGTTLSELPVGMLLKYQIGLNNSLGVQYVAPTEQSYTTISGTNNIQYNLQTIPTVTLKGTVKDKNSGTALYGATVSISQMLNGKYSKNIIVKTDKDGAFSVLALNDQTTITASYNSYVDQTIKAQSFSNSINEYNIMMAPINGGVITLDMSYAYSVAEGSSSVKDDDYSDYQDIRFTLFNQTKNKSITNYSIQYPDIVLLDPADANDVISISGESTTGKFNAIATSVTLDAKLKATATIEIVQNGSFNATCSGAMNASNVAMVYDSNGKFIAVHDYSSSNTVTSGELADGTYTIVSMSNSQYFNTIQNISQLSVLGLTKDVDYVTNSVTISKGVIKKLSIADIPTLDETKLYYTDGNTSFSVNKTSATAGSYFTLRGQVKFKDAYSNKVSNVKMIIELPENCQYVSGSMMIGSSVSGLFSENGNTLTVPLTNINDVVRFCIIPTQGGSFTANASIEFTLNGETIKQPIGTATFSVTNLSINVPSKTAQKTVTISGTASASSTVMVYDNNVLVGQTKSLANGAWQLKCELNQPGTFSNHAINAKVNTLIGITVNTETKQLIYDEKCLEVSKVTMINVAHPATSLNLCEYTTVFDFLNPSSKSPVYWYWPSYPTFTFKVEFTKNDPEIISDVVVNVSTSAGKTVKLKAVFDENIQLWIAKGDFPSGNLPVNVSVDYFMATNEVAIDKDYIISSLGQNFDNQDNTSPNSKIQNISTNETDNGVSSVFEYNGSQFELNSSVTPVPNVDVNGGYEYVKLYDNIGYYQKITEEVVSESGEVPKTSTKLVIPKEIFNEAIAQENNGNETNTGTGNLHKILTVLDPIITKGKYIQIAVDLFKCPPLSYATSQFLAVGKTASDIDKTHTIYDDFKNRITRLEENGCLGISDYRQYRADVAEKEKEYNQIKKISCTLGFAKFKTEIPKIDILLSELALIGGFLNFAGEYANTVNFISISRSIGEFEKNCSLEPYSRNDNYTGAPAEDVQDPSGYIYEAVTSNRLEGVTTTLFQKTTEEDMYGDKHDVVTVWDAESYGQVNPLKTDTNGMYAWDVPQGLWQVKYEKEGYVTAYSEWLPVPPPQLDVNTGMVRGAQPKVSKASGYVDGIEIVLEFGIFFVVNLDEAIIANPKEQQK